MSRNGNLIFRAVRAFLVLPGIMAGILPALLLLIPYRPMARSGWFTVPIVVGIWIIISAAIEFYRRGQGTLAPWDPPKQLVVEGMYRFHRNPMYVGVMFILFGWAGLTGSGWLLLYALGMWLAFHLRIVFYEERQLQRLFPKDWEDYRQHVPRWLVRLTPYEREHFNF